MKEYTLRVDTNDIALLAKALAALPFGEVQVLFAKLQAQIIEQDAPKPEKKK